MHFIWYSNRQNFGLGTDHPLPSLLGRTLQSLTWLHYLHLLSLLIMSGSSHPRHLLNCEVLLGKASSARELNSSLSQHTKSQRLELASNAVWPLSRMVILCSFRPGWSLVPNQLSLLRFFCK